MKVLRVSICLVLVLAMAVIMSLPMPTYGAYNDLEGYYAIRCRYSLNGMDLSRGDRYSEMTLVITDSDDSVLAGYIYFTDLVSLATGKITRGTGYFTVAEGETDVRLRTYYLDEAGATINCTRVGTMSVILPAGVTATVTQGTGTVTGSPVSCDEDDTTEITFTATGTATIELVGAYLVDGTGTFTNSPITLDGDDTVTCTATGTAKIYLPAGCTGTATSGTADVTDTPYPLVPGENTITVTISDPGTFDVEVFPYTYVRGFVGDGSGNTKFTLWSTETDDSGIDFVINGRVYLAGESVNYIKGTITGCLEPLSGTDYQISAGFKGTAYVPD